MRPAVRFVRLELTEFLNRTSPVAPLLSANITEREPTCQHERRPGTTVCLRCRHEALEAARLKQRAMFTRVGTIGAATVLIVALTAIGLSVTRGRDQGIARPRTVATKSAAAVRDSVTQSGEPVANGAIPPARNRAAAAALEPVLPVGRTVLKDSAIVTVSDSGVAVDFDQMMLRTRRPAKFEDFVRRMLPTIYGQRAQRALAAIPEGAIASQGDLLTQLPRTGVRIPLDGGHVMTVWPETRPGEDGPLVIRFRITVS